MKILTIFMDMVRADMLYSCNHNMKRTCLDQILEKTGGTIYNQCYTPAPDTPRSSACMWSGVFPRENECDSRIKWPRYFLSKDNTYLDELKKNGYSLNFAVPKGYEKTGLLPEGYEEFGTHLQDQESIKSFLENLDIVENSFTFIYLPDFHYGIDDKGISAEGYRYADQRISEVLEMVLETINIEKFDMTIMFSDHGVTLEHDEGRELLDTHRTNIFMMTRYKNQKLLEINKKLCSIMDIYPTICKNSGIPICKNLEGISLTDSEEHELLFMEDHKTFNVELGQAIEKWAVIDKKGIHFVGCDKIWNSVYEKNSDTLKEFERLLEEKMSSFEENTKAHHILQYYDDMKMKSAPKTSLMPLFTDMVERTYFESNYQSKNSKLKKMIIKWGKAILKI